MPDCARSASTTYATYSAASQSEADIVQVQTWMGHANVNTTRRYLHHKARKDDAKILDNAFALDSPPSENGDDPDNDVVTRLQRQVAEMAETLAGMRAGT